MEDVQFVTTWLIYNIWYITNSLQEEIRFVTIGDKYLGMLSEYLLHGWPLTRPDVQKNLQLH